jgi:tetratricopeptide (TPR) repeat protein
MVLHLPSRPKGNLLEGARKLHAIFQEEIRRFAGTRERSSGLVYCYNAGALLQYHYGEIERARQLSTHAIRLCLEGWQRSGVAAWVGDAVQPYINIGRLLGAQGLWRESLELFEAAWHFARGDAALEFQEMQVGAEAVALIPVGQRHDVLRVSENIRVADSLRVLLASQQYEKVFEFVSTIMAERHTIEHLGLVNASIIEGIIQAHLGLCHYREALDAIGVFINNTPDVCGCHSVVHLHVITAMQGLGKLAEARQALQRVAGGLEALTNGPVPAFALAQIWYLAAYRSYLLGDLDYAAGTARRSLALSRVSGNEATALKAAVLLSQVLDGSSDAASIKSCRDEMAQLANSTHYRLERAFASWELGRTTLQPVGIEHLRQSQAMFANLRLPHCGEYEADLAGALTGALDTSQNLPDFRHEALDDLYAELIDFQPMWP